MERRAAAYGIKEQDAAASDVDRYVQTIRLLGFVVIEGRVEEARLPEWRERLDRVLERQVAEGGGREALCALGEVNTARALLAYDESFLDLALDPVVLAVCERLLGDYFILNQQNGVVNPPASAGHRQASFHRDLPYQHFVSSRPLAVSALLCLDDFSAESGGTVVLPASHRLEVFPDDRVVADAETQVVARAGSVLIFDSMLYHRAGTNTGTAPRRAVNHVWSLPIVKQQVVLPALLRPELWASDPRLARLLGVESDPPRSVADWIASRRSRQGRTPPVQDESSDGQQRRQ
jgi:ectoine hydroxylase-related dioxygenase (phytanoyl-CoA dioxygenase family)